MLKKAALVLFALWSTAAPATAQSAGLSIIDLKVGSSTIPDLDAGSINLAIGSAPVFEKRNYVPFDHYSWLLQAGFGVYNGYYPGVKLGVTSTGGAFFDPYVGLTALFLGYPKQDQQDSSVFSDAPKEDFFVLGLIPEVGIRINYPATDKMAIFAAISWAFPMTVASYGAAASLTTEVGLGVMLYE